MQDGDMAIFIDTSPYIYLLENDERYGGVVKNFFDGMFANHNIFTSVITLAEFSVIPYRIGNLNDVSLLKTFLDITDTHIIQVDEAISLYSAKIRATYQGIKGIDALQLSAAIHYGCDIFFTNDKRLKKISEIRVVTVNEIQNE